jgi:hypothetical protein
VILEISADFLRTLLNVAKWFISVSKGALRKRRKLSNWQIEPYEGIVLLRHQQGACDTKAALHLLKSYTSSKRSTKSPSYKNHKITKSKRARPQRITSTLNFDITLNKT